jgi:transposase-like protein
MRTSMRKTLHPTATRVAKRLYYPLDVILKYVRWYVAYPLSLRRLEEMMLAWSNKDASSIWGWLAYP